MNKYFALTALLALALLLGGVSCARADEVGAWKTVYVKRGFVGNYDAGWAGGVGATMRMRVAIPFDGARVRVHIQGCFDAQTELAKMTLVKGVDDKGKITGPQYPILFGGQPGLTLEKGLKVAQSDIMEIPVTQGTWYLQDRYTSQKFPYAYEVDKEFFAPGEQFEAETMAKSTAVRMGVVTRIDVFTTDTRPSIACYGDSITHGYNATPDSGNRYPMLLGKLLNRPTLNLGVNGDQVIYAGGAPQAIARLNGVDTVVFLMGINDIISGRDFSLEKFTRSARMVIDGCHAQKLKFYFGTILPAGGNKAFDANPAKEALRLEINAWIRKDAGADGVIDFATALADTENPAKLQADCQSDWLHPNDLGYQKMAALAAQVIGEKK